MGKELLGQCMEYKDHVVRLGVEASNLLETFLCLLQGSVMDKYTYKHGKKEMKEFAISNDLKYFQWKPVGSSRNIRRFLITEIQEVTAGNSQFECRNHSEIKEDLEALCFTVRLKERPVNIVAKTTAQRDMWLLGLTHLAKGEKINYHETILKYDGLLTENFSKLDEELQNNIEKDIFKLSGSFMIDDNENFKLKKKLKELEKNNGRLTKELFEINSKADKEYGVEFELKKVIKGKEKTLKKLQSQLELLNLQFETLEKDCTHKILNFEEKLIQKDSQMHELQTEYDEFKKQIKENFNKTLVQKVQQYRESKEVMCSYVNFLKERLETIEKEVALWQAVIHSHVLPIYQSKKPGKPPQFKQVLEFALDTMERKLLTDRSQAQFMSLLAEARKNVKA